MQEDFTNLSGNLVRASLGGIKYSIFHLLFEICSIQQQDVTEAYQT
jgi:hypothetical protein